MKAMVLAAGLGTRLRPLTNNRPKALVEIAGRTLLEITLARLRDYGVREVIVNAHHFADMIVERLKASDNFGLQIEVSREEILLDTGGGLKKTAHFFRGSDEPFILHNVDVISTIDLRRMTQFHTDHRALATLAVQQREASRYLLFDDGLQLCGRRVGPKQTDPRQPKSGAGREAPTNRKDELVRSSETLRPLGFCGIHVISPRLLDMMPEESVFSIIASYLAAASRGERILAFPADEYYWRDLGTPENIEQAAEDMRQGGIRS